MPKHQNSGFSLLEKQILGLHYCGSYITNFELRRIGEQIGIETDLADREKMLKNLIKTARENAKEAELFAAIAGLLQERIKEYEALAKSHPDAADAIADYIQKGRSTIMLLRHRAKANPYE